MARQFQYYDPWRTEPLSCECGWSGTFQEGVTGHDNDLMESECPRCSKLVALVVFPTAEEVEQNEPEGSPFKEQVRATQKRWSAFRAMGLKSAEQLPEIAGEELLLEWDFESDGLDEKWTDPKWGAGGFSRAGFLGRMGALYAGGGHPEAEIWGTIGGFASDGEEPTVFVGR